MKWTNIGELDADKPIQYIDQSLSSPANVANDAAVNNANKSIGVINSRK